MSKTIIVAQREYLENLRTKTFWIGIFALPVLFALMIFIGRFLERSKDVRAYAILDRSDQGWLSAAVAEHAAGADMTALVRAAQSGTPEEKEALRKKQQEWFDALPEDHPLKELRRRMQAAAPDFDFGALSGDSQALAEMPAAARRAMISYLLEVQSQPARLAQLKSMATGIALARYRQVPLEDLAITPTTDPEVAREKLNEAINSGKLFAYFVVPADPVESDAGASYVSNNLTDEDLQRWFESNATEIVREKRIAKLKLTKEDAASIQANFDFKAQKVSADNKTEEIGRNEKASSFAPVAFVYLLWIAVFTAAQMLLTNTVEEKSNRLIEVLLSSVSPLQLMAGKVLGIAATGLTIVVSWVLTALIGAKLMPSGGKMGGVDLASIIGDPLYLTSFVAYFLAGYLLFAAILVALGSVCNSLKEAQNLMQPVFILLIVPLIAMVFVVQDPNGTVATFLTYIPLYTPFLMMNRAGGPPPAWEYVATTVLILVSLVVAFWAAAKIFRVGILMTGKPPKIREILRWLRAPVGAVHVAREPDAPK